MVVDLHLYGEYVEINFGFCSKYSQYLFSLLFLWS